MVGVARDFEAPIKIVFPKLSGGFTLLGLGDIVLPGCVAFLPSFLCIQITTYDSASSRIFIALALRFDYHLALSRNPTSPPSPSSSFAKIYFVGCTMSFILGLIVTISVMHYFQAGQPALLYLSPSCIGSVLSIAWFRGESVHLWGFVDGSSDDSKSKNEVKSVVEEDSGEEGAPGQGRVMEEKEVATSSAIPAEGRTLRSRKVDPVLASS